MWLPAHAPGGASPRLAAFFPGDRAGTASHPRRRGAALTGPRHVAARARPGLLDLAFARRDHPGCRHHLAVLIQAVGAGGPAAPGLPALLAPGFLRCLLLPMDAPWSLLIHDAGLVVFLGCLAWMGRAMLRGAREGDAASRHMLAALLLSLVPIAVEIAVVASGHRFPISGLFGLILAVALGHTRHAW
ncbi:MAG: hypothetical protein IPL96_05625 [Holophagaceae bacterium]|nr:hypothetical protein [Holophagaceae bacterium]